MSGKSRDCSQHKSQTGLLPCVIKRRLGIVFTDVCCGSVCGKQYFYKLDLTKGNMCWCLVYSIGIRGSGG